VSNRYEVRLAVPARPEFLGLARVTAAGLASRLGFTFDQVEDLRLAIDEMCFALIGNAGREGALELRFLLTDEGLTVQGEGRFTSPGPLSLSELSDVILDGLVDEHRTREGSNGPQFLLLKRRPGEGAGPSRELPGQQR
jgi:anti-sigma regulatory factor (Ser/Thr protein kinase)